MHFYGQLTLLIHAIHVLNRKRKEKRSSKCINTLEKCCTSLKTMHRAVLLFLLCDRAHAPSFGLCVFCCSISASHFICLYIYEVYGAHKALHFYPHTFANSEHDTHELKRTAYRRAWICCNWRVRWRKDNEGLWSRNCYHVNVRVLHV